MFTLFIIQLAYVLFTAALLGSMLVISSSLSTLLFLGALYLEHNPNSKRILLLSGIWLIVNMIFSMIQVLPALFTSFSLYTFLEVGIIILLYVGIYLFSMKYYKGNFYNKKENYIITLLVIPTILIVGYSLFEYIRLSNFGSLLDMTYVVVGILSRMIIPLAITTYTWLKHKNIE